MPASTLSVFTRAWAIAFCSGLAITTRAKCGDNTTRDRHAVACRLDHHLVVFSSRRALDDVSAMIESPRCATMSEDAPVAAHYCEGISKARRSRVPLIRRSQCGGCSVNTTGPRV